MKRKKILKKTERQIDKLVELYQKDCNQHKFKSFTKIVADELSTNPSLIPFVHTVKSRVKDPGHLKAKLRRKAIKARDDDENFNITTDNLFDKIHDLAGVRLLHLYTDQISDIDKALRSIFEEDKYILIEGPTANVWDIEHEKIFQNLGMEVRLRDETMYTSVHYVIDSNNVSHIKCEIQVRTLMEEVWGEVTHQINYPEKTDIACCLDQIKVLARTTSSCTRLVDSIFKSYKRHSSAK